VTILHDLPQGSLLGESWKIKASKWKCSLSTSIPVAWLTRSPIH